MIAAISQATTMAAPLAEELKQIGAGGFAHVEVWLPKVEEFLKAEPVTTVQKIMGDQGLKAVAGSFQGGLLRPPSEARKAHEDHFKRRLDLSGALKIPVLTIACEADEETASLGLGPILEGLVRASQWSEAYGVQLALEFSARHRLINNLETAAFLVKQANQPNLGISLDLFHFWTGPSKEADLALAREVPILLVQISDLAGTLREMATDSQRILPGDGDIPLGPLLTRLAHFGYQGPVSVELFNPRIWSIKPSQVAEVAYSALKRLLPASLPSPPLART